MDSLNRSDGGMKIVIVVEDDLDVRELVVDILSAENFFVLQAGHAVEALELLSTYAARTSLMFTDIEMPGPVDGLQLAHHVRSRWPWIALLIASGKNPLKAKMPPLCHFLAKPYSEDLILRHVQQLCC